MGFFKDFKDDLSQAVNELLPEEVLEEKDAANTKNDEEKAKEQELTTQVQVTKESLEDIKESPEEEEDDNVDKDILDAILTQEESANEEIPADKSDTEKNTDRNPKKDEPEGDMEDYDEVTVITKGTVISGSINSKGSMEIMGTIKGDIECQGKLSIIGLVQGNCIASEVYVGSKRFEGCITSEGNVKIGLGTVIIGDIAATSGVIAGAIKGDIDISGPIVIDSSAVIKGNIKAQSIQINNGAVIEGFCSLAYASVDIDNIFE